MEVNPELKRNLFLVLKEALNNSVKYSGAENIRIAFSSAEKNYMLSVEDDGKGMEENVIHGSGNGMFNMRSRMENSKGKFNITSEKNKGTKIILEGTIY